MAESSGLRKATRKRSILEDKITPATKKLKAERQTSKTMEELNHKHTFLVLLPNACNLVITLENPDRGMSVAEFVRTVKRRSAQNEAEDSARPVHWGSQCCLEDTMGNSIQDGNIIPSPPTNKPIIIVLQDGVANTQHTFQDMWDVTPEPHLLVGLPQEYTFETALADLIDNSLQAVWANKSGERRLISVHIKDGEISIFDSGQGMDGSKENSIAKWGTMGSSNHRSVRGAAIGGRPPYLKPFFGMYGFGGLAASMHLGGVVIVSSKTKTSKKVVTLRLEKETLVQKSKADRIWRTAGDIREVTHEEKEKSPHGSFTKVHICNLKSKNWYEDTLKCMLKDIYFPYIQNDGSDELVRTSTPVEFEVNGTNLTEVEGGEVVATNLASCNAPPFVLELHLQTKQDLESRTSSYTNGSVAEENANARISCFYFPILQGKERIDYILEKLDKEGSGVDESFESFCRVSIRRLGRLLPDARWGRLPFMEPKRRRSDNMRVPQQCFKRVKCFVETDAGFAPTTSKTDLAHKHPFTLALKNLGSKYDSANHLTTLHIEREGKSMSLAQLEKDYQEWIRAMHESYDEEVDCSDEKPVLIVNPCNKKDLGISQQVARVLTQIRRKGQLWKVPQKIKILKGAVGCPKKDLYATLEYVLCEGLEGDPGEARLICRPMECQEDEGCRLLWNDGIPSLDIRSSRSFPLDLISSGKCQMVDEDSWKRQLDKKQLKSPAFIDILNTEHAIRFDVDKGFPTVPTVQAGYVLAKEIIAVVRPRAFMVDNMHRASDGWDQKSIVKDSMEMKMDIIAIRNEGTSESSWGGDVKCSMQTKASSRNGVHGLYCFSTEGSQFWELFTKVGRYKFIFSLVNDICPNISVEKEISVMASEKIGNWKVCIDLSNPEAREINRLNVRLGSEIGPLYILCYDIFSNRIPFKTYPQFNVQVERMGKPLGVRIEKASGRLAQDGMYLQISKILLGGGDLELLRPSYEASLRVNNSHNSCFIEMPITVLPGELCSVKIISSQALQNCFRPGDVIHDLKLQVSDAFGNAVEKGQKIKVDLIGLEFQDQEGVFRKVDDQGFVNFGGLLKVTGNYGSKGSIIVSSDSKILLEEQFQILTRELKVISRIPEHCPAGSVLENVVFGIFDDRGNIDTDINGRQHALTIDLCPDNEIQYTFRRGKCTVPIIQLPAAPGILTFCAFHSISIELNVQIKVELTSNPRLELPGPEDQALNNCALTVCQGSGDGAYAICRDSDDDVVCQAHGNDDYTARIMQFNCCLMDDLTKLQEKLIRLGVKVKEREDRMRQLEKCRAELDNSLLALQGQIRMHSVSSKVSKAIDIGQLNQGCHSIEQTLEEIRSQGTNAAALWVDLRRRNHQASKVPYLEDVVGVVALLGKVETDLLSRVLSEYLGKDNMLAIVCKSYKGLEGLEKYGSDGKIDERCGLHGLATAQNRQVNGRFRVICLEDVRHYQGEFRTGDPQRQLKIGEPKLPNGNSPVGFLGYAVNMIQLDNPNLSSVTKSGHGLRESLFYHLFSCLQVYETRNDMIQARSYLTSGAISLDGGMIRCTGVLDFGNRAEVPVMFPTSPTTGTTSIFENAKQGNILAIEEQVRHKTQCKQRTEEEIKREELLLFRAKDKFNKIKEEMEGKMNQQKEVVEQLQQHGLCLENLENTKLISSC